MTIRCLTMHARYACRQSGACCTAGWPIPVETDRLSVIEAAAAAGRLTSARPAPVLWMRPAGAPSATPAVLHADRAGCVFFDAAGSKLCQIQRHLGHGALPLACREFPRVSVIDPRGTSVTLSHFCPTAAGLLEGTDPIRITMTAAAFPADTELSGLDMRTALPPLLRPDMSMDWDGWWDVERRAVDLLSRSTVPAATGLRTLADAIDRMSGWSPADGPLSRRIDEAFRDAAPRDERSAVAAERRLDQVVAAVPDEWRPVALERPGRPDEAIVRRFLAAHAFANWTAHLGDGLHAWFQSLQAAHALLDVGLGVRQADLLLRHLADPKALAQQFSGEP